MNQNAADQALFDEIKRFAAASDHPAIVRFKAGLEAWGDSWQPVEAVDHASAATLAECLDSASDATRPMIEAFHTHRATRKWEQSYKKSDGLVGDDMLAGYGFAEVVGKWGPFVSDRIRSGLGTWKPGIVYPAHRHQPEEVYVVMGGSAEFTLGEPGDEQVFIARAGDVVHVPSMLRHGLRTLDEPVAIFYLWQAGNLRETSSFT